MIMLHPSLSDFNCLPLNYWFLFKTTTLVYRFFHSGSPNYFGPYLSLSSCSCSTRLSYPNCHYLTVPLFRSSHFGLSFAFDALKIWNDFLVIYVVPHLLLSLGKSSKITCFQMPIHHSLSITPVLAWYIPAKLLDLQVFTLVLCICALESVN